MSKEIRKYTRSRKEMEGINAHRLLIIIHIHFPTWDIVLYVLELVIHDVKGCCVVRIAGCGIL